MKQITLIFLILMQTLTALAQAPPWGDESTRKSMYPGAEYYVGYANLIVDRKDDVNEMNQIAVRNAKMDLVESIKVSIQSTTESFVNEKVTSTEGNNLNTDFLSDFTARASIIAAATLDGVKKTGPVYDKRTHKVYALVFISKKEILMKQKGTVDRCLISMGNNYEQAKLYKQRSDEVEALKKLVVCDELYKQIDESQGMIITISGEMYKYEDYLKTKNAIDLLYSEIIKSKVLDDVEAANMLFDGLKLKTGSGKNFKYPIIFENFTYEESIYSSKFANMISRELGKLFISDGFTVLSQISDEMKRSRKEWLVVKGNYFVMDKSLRVYVTMVGMPTKKSFAQATSYVSKSWLDEQNTDYIPEQITRVEKLRDNIDTDEPGDDFRLVLETYPNVESRQFIPGDTLRMYLSVNKPAYIRLLYLEADGDVAMICDDFKVDANDVGKLLDLENRKRGNGKAHLVFASNKPSDFGDETIFVAASSVPFHKLNTKRDYIVDINGKRKPILIVTDKDYKAIEITKSAFNPSIQGDNLSEPGDYYSEGKLPVRVVPEFDE